MLNVTLEAGEFLYSRYLNDDLPQGHIPREAQHDFPQEARRQSTPRV
jgi:hypothetical protein